MKWLELLKTIGPLVIASTVPGGQLLAPIVVGAIHSAEQLKGASGAEKKAHALELVEAGAAAANAVAGKVVVDPNAAVAAAASGIDTVVKTINAAHSGSQEQG